MMYLHIGNGNNIKKSSIIGIFDLDTATVSQRTRRFISEKEREGCVRYNDADLPRSFLLCEEEGRVRVELSRISAHGLCQRAEEKGEFGTTDAM